MSGVYGYMQNQNRSDVPEIKAVDLEGLKRWNRAYGMDGEALQKEDRVCLGCFLEKLASASAGSCAVLRSGDCYAVLDAVLYNREELLTHCGKTEELSDEALLFQYILQFGTTELSGVNGDFCGAVYNQAEQTILFFRDHMGVRPLFYYADDGLVAFSTDIRGLLSMKQVNATVSEEWIYRTVSGYWKDDIEATEFQNIFCVPPGGTVKFSFAADKLVQKKQRYWRPGQCKIRYSSEKEYISRLRELIVDSIQRRLDAIPGIVGAELSGGLDSSVISILIHRLGRKCVYFSWSTDPEKLPYVDGDERLIVKDICEQERLDCHYIQNDEVIMSGAGMTERMQEILPTMDPEEPPAFRFVLPAYINTLPISETSRNMRQCGVRAVFTGHCGDEGVSHRSNPYELFYHGEYLHYLKAMWARSYREKNRISGTLKGCRQNLVQNIRNSHKPYQSSFHSEELLKASFSAAYDKKKMPELTFSYHPKHYVIHGGSRNRLDNVALQGAYCGVRYLIPYADYRVIDFALSIPRHLYLCGNQNRYIYREAFRDLMPKSLYDLKGKEDVSRKNTEENPDWYEEFRKQKEELVGRLDRGFWEKYLDYTVITEWLKQEKPPEEDFSERSIFQSLYYCAMVENLVRKTRV